jgi:hypothetical protein
MSDRPIGTYWVPMLIAAGILLLGVPLADLSPAVKAWANPAAVLSGLVLLVIGGLLAYRMRSASADRRAGRGGGASVDGNRSTATGGAGGNAADGMGGRGGDAMVRGNKSTATGGRGGNA